MSRLLHCCPYAGDLQRQHVGAAQHITNRMTPWRWCLCVCLGTAGKLCAAAAATAVATGSSLLHQLSQQAAGSVAGAVAVAALQAWPAAVSLAAPSDAAQRHRGSAAAGEW
jgi:hypothetical protein